LRPSGYVRFRETAPDVVIMDIIMPGRGGIDAIRQIRQADPSARILVFSMHATVSYAVQAIRAGARGYITKSSASDLMVEAVRNVLRNKLALCAEISEALATSHLEEQATALDQLSPQEFEVLRMIIDAKSTEEIATAFHLTPKTVANYHYIIKSKLGASSDIDYMYFCMRHGMVTPLITSMK